MGKQKADYLLRSDHIFTSTVENPFAGYVAVSGQNILAVGTDDGSDWIDEQTEVLELEDQLVTPGFIDVHTFFTGYAIFHIGIDMSGITSQEEFLQKIKEQVEKEKEPSTVFGHGWNPNGFETEGLEEKLNEAYPDRAVIVFAADRSTCMMNRKAEETYGFNPKECYPEAYHKIMPEYLNDREFIEPEFKDYMKLMNSRGVTTVKEMGFDDFYGFTDYLKEIENSDDLHLRFFFMSQPVGAPMNLEYAKRMREKFKGDKIRFSGFNRMTDGTIADYKGELKKPYEKKDFVCSIDIPWNEIEQDVLEADKEGFRWSLHAQGDGAVAKIAKIYDKCKKVDGKLVNKQALTDMEFTSPEDLEKLGKIGVNAELYFQIMSLDPGNVLKENIERTIGNERGKYYWNRRKMEDSGINLCGATDLPLLITSVPESIYYSCGGYMDGEEEPFQTENTLSAAEILKAWTLGGQKSLEMEDKLGTFEEGKIADIAIFDRDLTTANPKTVKDAKVILTILDGKIIYKL